MALSCSTRIDSILMVGLFIWLSENLKVLIDLGLVSSSLFQYAVVSQQFFGFHSSPSAILEFFGLLW